MRPFLQRNAVNLYTPPYLDVQSRLSVLLSLTCTALLQLRSRSLKGRTLHMTIMRVTSPMVAADSPAIAYCTTTRASTRHWPSDCSGLSGWAVVGGRGLMDQASLWHGCLNGLSRRRKSPSAPPPSSCSFKRFQIGAFVRLAPAGLPAAPIISDEGQPATSACTRQFRARPSAAVG